MDRLPNRPNLRHLRQQAKALLSEQRTELRATEPKLSSAQRLVAQRYGFTSWPALKHFVERMSEVEQHVRKHAVTPRRRFASVEISMELLRQGALEHPSPAVRRQCLDLLDHHGDETIGPTVVSALRDPVPRVRRHAIHALTCEKCRIGPLAVDVVGELVRIAHADMNEKVRLQAVDAIGRHAPFDERARIALEHVAASEPSTIVANAAAKLLQDPRASYQGSIKVQRRRARATGRASQ